MFDNIVLLTYKNRRHANIKLLSDWIQLPRRTRGKITRRLNHADKHISKYANELIHKHIHIKAFKITLRSRDELSRTENLHCIVRILRYRRHYTTNSTITFKVIACSCQLRIQVRLIMSGVWLDENCYHWQRSTRTDTHFTATQKNVSSHYGWKIKQNDMNCAIMACR